MKKMILLLITLLILSCVSTKSETKNSDIQDKPMNNYFLKLQNNKKLLQAIREKDILTVKKLLEEGQIIIDPPYRENMVNKPLAYASIYGNLEIVKEILKYNPDIDGQIAFGGVAVLRAIEKGNLEIAKELINAGANVNIPNSFGYSAFTGMCLLGYKDLIELSLKNGARVNEMYVGTNNVNDGKTCYSALHNAVLKNHYDVTKILLENGANPNLKAEGISSFDIAKENNNTKILDLLEKYKNVKQEIKATEKVKLFSNEAPDANNDLQYNADIVRLNHLEYYGKLINEYYLIKGEYPFQKFASIPVYVHIANDQQEKFTKEKLPFEHKLFSHKEFIFELESVLGRDIPEYFDPQYAPDLKPNFYIYSITNNMFFFAIHVSKKYSFSKKVSNGYYKVEISNILLPFDNFYTVNHLIYDKDFIYEKSKPITKVGYFKERENKYINFSNN